MSHLLPDAPDWLREVPLAHRGLHDEDTPENSLAAFAAAASAGVGVELDAQLTRDGAVVVAHDPDLQRTAGRPDRIADLDLATLRDVPLAAGQRVPTLDEALEVLADVPVMVEVKNYSRRVGLLEEEVADALKTHVGPVCVASFNPRVIAWFRDHAPAVVRVQTAGPLGDVRIPEPLRWSLKTLRWLRWVRPHGVAYDIAGIEQPSLKRYRRAGGTVIAWTVDTDERLAIARRHADNVIFEHLPVPAVVQSDRARRS